MSRLTRRWSRPLKSAAAHCQAVMPVKNWRGLWNILSDSASIGSVRYFVFITFQDVGFTPTHIDAVGSLSETPILVATIFSTMLLVAAIVFWITLFFRPVRHRFARRLGLILSGPLLFLAAAVFQIWIGEVLYRYYFSLDSAVSVGLYVPIAPVWWSGAFSGIAFLAILGFSKKRARRHNTTLQPPSRT